MENIVFAVWVSGRLEFSEEEKRECFEISKGLVELATKVRKNGLLSLDGEITAMYGFMKTAFELAVDGIHPDIIKETMYKWTIFGNYRGARLLRRLLIIDGVVMIVNGCNPKQIHETLSAYFGEDLLQEYNKYADNKKRQDNGLPFLIEDFWYNIKDKQMHREPGANLLEEIFRTLDDMAVQMLMRNIEMQDWIIAAKGSSKYVIDRIIHNVSSNNAQTIVDNICCKTSIRFADTIAAQNRILTKIKELEERGEIVFKDKSAS